MADWIMETSRRPNRPLAVAASTAVLSTLCGRHLYGPTMTALNLYIAALAETAVGKDRPFKAPYELLKAAGYGHLHQTLKVFSVSGVEGILIDAPCCLATVDELGRVSSRGLFTSSRVCFMASAAKRSRSLS
jgi:hypothetical protein